MTLWLPLFALIVAPPDLGVLPSTLIGNNESPAFEFLKAWPNPATQYLWMNNGETVFRMDVHLAPDGSYSGFTITSRFIPHIQPAHSNEWRVTWTNRNSL